LIPRIKIQILLVFSRPRRLDLNISKDSAADRAEIIIGPGLISASMCSARASVKDLLELGDGLDGGL
jgi:hypothetical protein